LIEEKKFTHVGQKYGNSRGSFSDRGLYMTNGCQEIGIHDWKLTGE